MIKDKLLKQSTFYKETRDEGITRGREEGMSAGITRGRESGVRSVLAARFGSVSDRLSGRIHLIMERNGSLFDDIIKLAATAKDMGEFERKLDRMA
jgi:predicted transposase YdaD